MQESTNCMHAHTRALWIVQLRSMNVCRFAWEEILCNWVWDLSGTGKVSNWCRLCASWDWHSGVEYGQRHHSWVSPCDQSRSVFCAGYMVPGRHLTYGSGSFMVSLPTSELADRRTHTLRCQMHIIVGFYVMCIKNMLSTRWQDDFTFGKLTNLWPFCKLTYRQVDLLPTETWMSASPHKKALPPFFESGSESRWDAGITMSICWHVYWTFRCQLKLFSKFMALKCRFSCCFVLF